MDIRLMAIVLNNKKVPKVRRIKIGTKKIGEFKIGEVVDNV